MHSRCASWRQITALTFLHTCWLKITASAFRARLFGGGGSQEGGRGGSNVGHWISSFQTLLWQLIPGCSSVWWQLDFHVFPKVFYGLFTRVLWITFPLPRNFQIVKNTRWFLSLSALFFFVSAHSFIVSIFTVSSFNFLPLFALSFSAALPHWLSSPSI